MAKKRLSPITITVLLAIQTVASAFGGTYPSHTTGYLSASESSTLTQYSNSTTDANYTFTVDGKKFILLDTDAEGNYFVLADDLYGQHAFDTSYARGYSTIERSKDGNIEPYDYSAFNASDILFSATDPTNIGFWLNNDFLESGNGSGKILPDSIKDNIITAVWSVEGQKTPVVAYTATQYSNGSKTGTRIASEFVKGNPSNSKIESYTVECKIALMSVTEYKKYQNIIGFTHSSEEWRGMMLRTPRLQFYSTEYNGYKYIHIGWGDVMVRNNGSGSKMIMVYNDDSAAQNGGMFVRPCFWLDKDFFKNVKIDFESAGSVPKAEIMKNKGLLLGTYTADEINELSEIEEGAPELKEVGISGTPIVGSVITAQYEYLSSIDEGNSEFYWMVSDTADGEYKVKEQGSKNYTIKPEDLGKYITFAVVPKDINAVDGKIFVSEDVTSAVVAPTEVFVKGIEKSAGTATISLSNPQETGKSARIIVAEYDSQNMLVSETQTSVIVSGDIEQNIPVPTPAMGNTVSIMVWVNNSNPLILFK